MKINISKSYYIYIVALISILMLSLGDSFFNFVLSFDENILLFLDNNQYPNLLNAMKFISFIGSSAFLVPAISITVVLLIFRKKYREILMIISASLGSLGINSLLKNIIKRERPVEFFKAIETSYSFPSGHAMVAASLSFTIAYILTKNKSQASKKKAYIIASIYTVLMSFSRLYLGVHYPIDVIFGIFYGITLFILIRDLFLKF
ncbi:MAG: phosphatase PAP2 family protein [Tissierellales bacterium]|nr:phosphatase PAP2 family protein [Tissierellales bacterium]